MTFFQGATDQAFLRFEFTLALFEGRQLRFVSLDGLGAVEQLGVEAFALLLDAGEFCLDVFVALQRIFLSLFALMAGGLKLTPLLQRISGLSAGGPDRRQVHDARDR